MTNVRARLAALRTRRKDRNKATSAAPVCVDPALAAAAAAVGEPQQSWDADFKERLAGQVGSDDELDDIVVLPPTPVKLDPIAARIAWRKEQQAAAKKKAQRILAEQYPVVRIPKQEDLAPKEDVNDEEELLLEEEVDDDGDEDNEESAEEQSEEEMEEGTEKSDEETKELGKLEGDETKKTCNDGVSVGKMPIDALGKTSGLKARASPVPTAKSDTDVIASSQISGPTSALSKCPTQSVEQLEAKACKDAAESKKGAQRIVTVLNNCVTYNESPVTPESSCGALPTRESTSSFEPTSTEKVSPPDDSGTVDSSRVTVQLKTGSSSTAKSNAQNSVWPNSGQAFTASSGRKGPFSKLFAARVNTGATVSSCPAPAALNSAFIDDEAEDELDGPDDAVVPHTGGDTDEDEELQDVGVVADSHMHHHDAERLAQFHRKWEEKNDEVVLKNIAEDCKDIDNAMDLTELLKRKEKASLENEDAASEFCMGSGSLDRSREAADDYVDSMFRDDDSLGIFKNDFETPEKNEEDIELSKRKARALWRARQKNRSAKGGDDENSISLLGLFTEADKDRTNHHRRQIETACRSASIVQKASKVEKSGKRKSNREVKTNDLHIPEWERRRICLERVEKRRRTAVSIDKWSYASDALDRATRAATLAERKPSKVKPNAAVPVGGGSYAPKPMEVQKVRAAPGRRSTAGSKRRPVRHEGKTSGKKISTFTALFDALDQRPTTDVS